MRIKDVLRKKKTKSIMFTRRVYPETYRFLKKINLDLLVRQLKQIEGKEVKKC